MKHFTRTNDTAPTFSKAEAEDEERVALEILAMDGQTYPAETEDEIMRRCNIVVFEVATC